MKETQSKELSSYNKEQNKKNKKLSNNKEIDLVVPVYKAKGTLTRLLASVLVQTYKDKIHIILVQDCDGENYKDIISFFDTELEIELVQMDKNSGPGTCRRIGMQKGNNKYITCMDADDTFQNPFAIEELYNFIEAGKFDAVNSIFLEQVTDGISFISHDNDDWIWVFGKMYRRSFLEENKIEMNDSRANEDTGFNSIISTVGKVGFMPDITYIWHFKEDSITRKDGGIYRFTGIEGWLYNMKYAVDNMVRLKTKETKIKKFVSANIVCTFLWFLEFGQDKDKRVNVKEYLKWVNKYYKEVYTKHKPTKKQLNEEFASRNTNLGFIPAYTFEQYLRMVGEGYGK